MTAVPYLGDGLDLSLFDVTALAASQVAAATVPVSIAHTGAAPNVPGLTVTGSDATTESGYLGQDGADQFGAALTSQYLVDKGKPGKPALFGGAARISRKGAAAAPKANPNFVMRTVTIAGNDTNGRPNTGALVAMINVDDLARYAAASEMFQGTAKFSVPDGNYLALAVYTDTDANGVVTAEHDVFDTQLSISTDQTVQLDAKQATSKLAFSTPKPALNSGGSFWVERGDANGRVEYVQLGFLPGTPVWVSPQLKPVTVGTLSTHWPAASSGSTQP
ncbi:hypothetical protein [Kutzneria sp. CA-103260]|uniref:hypothetical protein n=1 Tax=Kutzneria sp. CA-103260 TaxID=2802641 RepID=UPI001BABAFAB|nr:hypothetical protein [Kutzneria sp. CA-103260]QUQ68874.1 hypothetical protein JJ691_66210 [Kutzneria sp. CA-103260]